MDLLVDKSNFKNWRNNYGTEIGTAISLNRPSIKSLVALALSERATIPSSYEELGELIQRRVGPNKKAPLNDLISKESMRVAVSGIANALRSAEHPLQLTSQKFGREVKLILNRTSTTNLKQLTQTSLSGSRFFRDPEIDKTINPREICRSLLRDGGGLPFANAYSNYRAAANWLSYSTGYASKKRLYEGSSFSGYELLKKLKLEDGKTLGVVGLACGEGLGEIELLEQILPLTKARGIKIEYLAVDSSEFLLLSHSQLIQERFSKELSEGSLVAAYSLGDLYKLKNLLNQVRTGGFSGFMSGPIVACYFGNCLGNYEYHEWDFFRSLMEAFPKGQQIASLVGVSLMRRNPKGEPIPERYTLSPFWLETPRHLMYELNLLQSKNEKNKKIPLVENHEFILSTEESQKYIPLSLYETSMGVKGVAYRFYYNLKNNIETWDGEHSMPKGSHIHLYSIIKYDLASLVSAFSNLGWKVEAPPKNYEIQEIVSGEETFHYCVFLALRN